jgi:hypothetical protein
MVKHIVANNRAGGWSQGSVPAVRYGDVRGAVSGNLTVIAPGTDDLVAPLMTTFSRWARG